MVSWLLARYLVNSTDSKMIDRYTLPEMGALWSSKTSFRNGWTWRSPFAKSTPTMASFRATRSNRSKRARSFSVDRINEIEKTTNHDVIAFTTNLAESIGEASRFVHYGLTSSDVVDTANALLLRDASDILLRKSRTTDFDAFEATRGRDSNKRAGRAHARNFTPNQRRSV
jgi:adenylosuccinate lyase